MKCAEIKVQVIREALEAYRARTPEEIYTFWKAEVERSAWWQDEKEAFVVILLSAKNHIKGYNLVSLGLLDCSLAHPREVFRAAIIGGAVACIVAHNHPSGDTTPSAQDITTTKQLQEAGRIIGISLLDSVIIGDASEGKPGFCSLRETGQVQFA